MSQDFLSAVFDDAATKDIHLVAKLSDPLYEGPFLTEAFKATAIESLAAVGGESIHRGAIVDRYAADR